MVIMIQIIMFMVMHLANTFFSKQLTVQSNYKCIIQTHEFSNCHLTDRQRETDRLTDRNRIVQKLN